MMSQSKSSISIALCLSVVIVAASTVQAQLSATPRRYRNESKTNAPQEFGRRQQHDERARQQQRKNAAAGRKMEEISSVPLETLDFDMSAPIQSADFDMSAPIQTAGLSMPPLLSNDFDMSMPIMQSGFDLSMPTEEITGGIPTNPRDGVVTHGDELIPLTTGSVSGGSDLILASFLAGISALVIAAAALFVKMRRVRGMEVEENQERDDAQMRVASFDENDLEGGCRGIVIA